MDRDGIRGSASFSAGMSRRIIIPNEVDRLLAAQDGVSSTRQAEAFGLTEQRRAVLVRDERWSRVARGAYIRGVGRPSFGQLLWVGHLVAGEPSAIGGRAALVHLGVGLEPDEVSIVVPAEPRRRLPPPFVPLRDGFGRLAHVRGTLPLVRPEDALLEATEHESLEEFVALATGLIRSNRATAKSIAGVLRLRSRHRGKDERLEVLADLQGIESNLEFLFRRDVERAHSLPKSLRQVRVGSRRLDCLYERYGVIVEIDGRAWHADRRFRDCARQRAQRARASDAALRQLRHPVRAVSAGPSGRCGPGRPRLARAVVRA